MSDELIARLDSLCDPDWELMQDTTSHIIVSDNVLSSDVLISPVSNNTHITLALPHTGLVCVRLYRSDGRLVETMVNGYRRAGSYSLQLNNTSLSSGVYFLNVIAGTHSLTTRIVLTK